MPPWKLRARNGVARVLAVAALGSGAVIAGTAAPAWACTPAPGGGCYTPKTYFVSGTDGTLAVQSQPNVNHLVKWLSEGAAVQLICQINYGGETDGVPSHTWDFIAGNGWVYDHYITTPAQDSHGWSPGVPRCGTPLGELATDVAVPNLQVNQVQAESSPAYVFADGPGYYRAANVRGIYDGGACQDFVMANTNFWWLWDSWDGYYTLNHVATWPSVSQAYGRTVSSTPLVGDIVVFNPGWHGPWNYGSGHVAMVVNVNDSSSFTVAEYNWNANGGGYGIMDYRRVSMNDGAVQAFIR
jgi:hypothetical protein